MAGRNAARALHVGIYRDGGELLRTRLAGKFVQPEIAEAEKRQTRCVTLHALAAGVVDLRFGRAVIRVVEIAVAVEDLAVRDFYAVARVRIHAEGHIPRHILAEIYHRFALGRAENARGLNALVLTDGLALSRNQAVLGILRCDGRGQKRKLIKRRVVDHAVVKVAEAQGALRDLPAFVGQNRGVRAVGVVQMQLRDDRARLFPRLARGFAPRRHVCAHPARADRHGQRLFARMREKLPQLVALVLKPRAVARPAGRQNLIRDPLALQPRFVNSCGRDVKPRACQRLFNPQRLSVDRADAATGPRRRDPICIPLHPCSPLDSSIVREIQ